MKTLVINEKNVGYVKIFKDEVKNFEDYRGYKNLPNAVVEREGTADEYVVFKTFDLSKAVHKKSYLLQERNWCEMTLIEVNGIFKDTNEQFAADAAIGQWDGVSNDDHIFYWFDDFDKVVGEHPDFIISSYKEV